MRKLGSPPAAPEADLEKHGSKAIRSAHAGCVKAIGQVSKTIAPLDDGVTRDFLESTLADAKKSLKKLKDFHREKFGDEAPLDGDDDGGDADPEKMLDRLHQATTELQVMQHAERVEHDTYAKRAEQARLQILTRFNR